MNIDSYRFGEIVVEGKRYTSDLIIYPDRVEPDWWRKEGHRLRPEDLPAVLAAAPEILVVGTGASGAMIIPPSTRDFYQEHGVELRAENTDLACAIYNELSQGRRVVGAFHLTC